MLNFRPLAKPRYPIYLYDILIRRYNVNVGISIHSNVLLKYLFGQSEPAMYVTCICVKRFIENLNL